MTDRQPNERLARLMQEAGFESHKSFARAVVAESEVTNGPLRRCDHTDVARWLSGMTPRGTKPIIIASALSRRLRRKVTLADIGMASSAAALSPHLGLSYPQTAEEGTENVTALWHADLSQSTQVVRAQLDPTSWNDASLEWLISPGGDQLPGTQGSLRVGLPDVVRFTKTIEVFAELDDRFGGGHARRSLIEYLTDDAERLLRGRFSENVGKKLFSAVAEATLLAAWMAYDSAPTGGLAQRYFVQALRLAQAGDDRLLGASILDAMSHQATFAGRYREAANLARAALSGTKGVATATLTAHFHSMEARAYARLGEARACDRALSEASRAFERRNPADDPLWMQYFDDAEFSAELGHCFRDLRRPLDAAEYASLCLGVSDNATSTRSQFFATMVLADAYLGAANVEQACATALQALQLADLLRSARCVDYLRNFRKGLDSVGPCESAAEFGLIAADSRLWRIAVRPTA